MEFLPTVSTNSKISLLQPPARIHDPPPLLFSPPEGKSPHSIILRSALQRALALGHMTLFCRCEPLRDTNPLRYYIATCSSSNINPHSVTFYTDSTCTMVHQDATTAAPGAPAGTMAALEYPCVAISGTSSISAGGHNEALHGVGSVLLWSRSNSCSGLNDVGTSRVVHPPRLPPFPSARSCSCMYI